MDDFTRAFGLFSGVAFIFAAALMPYALLGLAIPYAILHVRDSRSLERDPQLGIKTVMYFFYSLSILLILAGLTIIAIDLVRDQQQFIGGPVMGRPQPPRTSDWFNPAKRNGTALIIAGFAFGLLQFVLLKTMTNDQRWPLPRRVFGGWRLAIEGLVVLIAFALLVMELLQENMNTDSLKNFLAILFVWGPAGLVDLALLRIRSARRGAREEYERPPRAEIEE